MKTTLFLSLLFIFVAGLVARVANFTPIANSPVQALAIEHCPAQPCLFGKAIADSSRGEVQQILDTSPLTGEVTFYSGRRLNWQWSAEAVNRLWLDETSRENWSYVALNEHHAEEVRLILDMRLADLLPLYGLPQSAIPYMATQRGDLHYLLTFQEVQGFFEVALRCGMTDLTPDTPVVSYLSKDIPNVERLAVVTWHVYTTTLPNCSIFRP